MACLFAGRMSEMTGVLSCARHVLVWGLASWSFRSAERPEEERLTQ